MTVNEAISRLEDHNRIHCRREPYAIHLTEAINMAVDALKKQIEVSAVPRNVTRRVNYGFGERMLLQCEYICPCCKRKVDKVDCYCRHCGNALEWPGE